MASIMHYRIESISYRPVYGYKNGSDIMRGDRGLDMSAADPKFDLLGYCRESALFNIAVSVRVL